MIARIAVAAANFAIDKPYSYFVPSRMELTPGMRVQVPFGRGNRQTEGVVLAVEEGPQAELKAVERCLDDKPVLSEGMLRLAAFLRERYFCTFYDAIRTMLPAGLWFQQKDTYELTEDLDWQEKTIRDIHARKLLELLRDCGGQTEGKVLKEAVPSDEDFEKAIGYLIRKKCIQIV